jgi:hypothetical protein
VSAERHRQVLIEHDGATAHVDEGIADLVLGLWRRGMHTTASCEDFRHATDGKCEAYVQFESEDDARTFEQLLPHDPIIEVCVEIETGDPWYPIGSVGIGFNTADIPAVLASLEASARGVVDTELTTFQPGHARTVPTPVPPRR